MVIPEKNNFFYLCVKRLSNIYKKSTNPICKIEEDLYFCRGELAEWSIAAVLKTVDLLKGPRVRIPHSPPKWYQNQQKACKSYDSRLF